MLYLKQHKRILLSLILFGFFRVVASASEIDVRSGEIKKEVKEHKMRFGLTSGATFLSYDGKSANGVGVGVLLQYALSEKWALKTSFNQSFYVSGFAALNSAVDFRMVYALTGSLVSKNETILIGGSEVLKSHQYFGGGLRLEVQSDLYFFNSVDSVIPFTGLGLGINYEFPSFNKMNYSVGVRMDYLSNSSVDLNPIQLYFGVLF